MKLKDYLKSERQWPRHCRIAHAEYQLANATSRRSKDFWRAVLKANGAFVRRPPRAANQNNPPVQLKEAA